MATLSILIPTYYNRFAKLQRLIKILDSEIVSSGLKGKITILVSDNGSTDETQAFFSSFSSENFIFKYFRQEKPRGFDGNIQFLYAQCGTDYAWFFADDDIPFTGSVAKVWNTINQYLPDVLLFSFVQPPGSTTRAFNYSSPVEIITEPKAAIEVVQRLPKITIYILRKVEFSEAQRKELEPFLSNGYSFLDFAYTILGASTNLKVGVISEALATCDEDWVRFEFIPKVFFEYYCVFTHPFVVKHLPDFAESKRLDSYYCGIQFLFAIKTGVLLDNDMDVCNRTIKGLTLWNPILLKNPRAFLQLLAMKSGISVFYPKIRPLLNLLRRRLKNVDHV